MSKSEIRVELKPHCSTSIIFPGERHSKFPGLLIVGDHPTANSLLAVRQWRVMEHSSKGKRKGTRHDFTLTALRVVNRPSENTARRVLPSRSRRQEPCYRGFREVRPGEGGRAFAAASALHSGVSQDGRCLAKKSLVLTLLKSTISVSRGCGIIATILFDVTNIQ